MLLGRLFALLDDIGNLLGIESADGLIKIRQDGNDLGMMHCVIECEGGS